MSAKTAKIGITSLVLLTALFGLLWTTLSEGTEYYKHVDEVMTSPAQWYGKKLQLHGHVVDGSILRKRDTLDYRFQVENNGQLSTRDTTAWCPTPSRTARRWWSRARSGPTGSPSSRTA